MELLIGDNVWCDECGSDYVIEAGVMVGQQDEYGHNTAVLCRACIVKALELIDGTEQRKK